MEQWVALAIALFTFLNLILSGRAAVGMAATRKAVRGLVSVIGHPSRDRVDSTSLIEEVQTMTHEFGHFRDVYKRDQDNLLVQLRTVQARQERHDEHEPPVRDGDEDTAETWRN